MTTSTLSYAWPRCDVDGCSGAAEFEVAVDGRTELRCAMGIRAQSGQKRRLQITDFPWYQPTPAVGVCKFADGRGGRQSRNGANRWVSAF